MTVQLASPYFLLLLLLVPLLFWSQRRDPERKRPSLRFPSLVVAGRVAPSLRLRYGKLLPLLRYLGLALLIVGLARPQGGRASEIVPAQGIDIALALDVSFSMAERDLGAKSRLGLAKEVVQEFIAGRENDRVGLVVFAQESAILSPMTLDHPTLAQLLEKADHGKLPEGTAIGMGLANSVNLLRDSRAKSRIVILLTDGQNNAGEVLPRQAAQMAALLGIKVYTIGVGRPSSVRGGGRVGDRFPPLATGSVDEETLRHISETTGGAYFLATDKETLRSIYQLIGQLEKSELGKKRFAALEEWSHYLLLSSWLLLFVEAVVSNTIFRRLP